MWQPPNARSPEAGGALCLCQPAQCSGTLPRMWQGAPTSCQPGNTLNCPQESLLLYLRSAHPSCLAAARFLHPRVVQVSIPDAFLVSQKTRALRQGGGEGRRAGTLHGQPLPCATRQWLFPCPAPSRQPSPSLPVLSGCAGLCDLPREHSVCLGDMWPELTSLQTVSK